ncbi:hypothetical protein DWY47_16795 [Ruminococcus sp. AF25-23LB]|nr:hypothetical protein DWY47_16795 [Ruminococcus sp. AF25-23LB]
MRHIDEIQIAGTAILLCGAMFAVSAVAPTGNTVSKAVTNFTEAPETAAEAQHRQKLRLRRMDLPFILRKVTMILIMTTVIMILLTMTLLTILIQRRTVLWMIQGRRMIIQIQKMDLLMMEAVIRHRLTIQGMILPIRLIIPAMTIPVTAQMVLWITLIHGKTMERKFSR